MLFSALRAKKLILCFPLFLLEYFTSVSLPRSSNQVTLSIFPDLYRAAIALGRQVSEMLSISAFVPALILPRNKSPSSLPGRQNTHAAHLLLLHTGNFGHCTISGLPRSRISSQTSSFMKYCNSERWPRPERIM